MGRFHTGLCKFLRNISTNIYSLGKRTDFKLEEVSFLFISYSITISWLHPLYSLRFAFLLRDSDSNLSSKTTAHYKRLQFDYAIKPLIRPQYETHLFANELELPSRLSSSQPENFRH